MSRRLRPAVLAALGLALPCAAAGQDRAPTPSPTLAPPAQTAETGLRGLLADSVLARDKPRLGRPVPTPLPVFAPLGRARTQTSPLLSPALSPMPAEPGLAAATPGSAQVEVAGPPAAAAPTPAIRSGQEVFARLRRGLSPNACDAGRNSARWRQRYAGSPTVFARRLEGVLPLIDFVGAEVERAGLPAEFTFIPLVESWYQPGAIGPGGPSGMWQMIASTARNHGIHIRAGYDGRLSPVESTRAALSYLKVLEDMFGNWQAIVMAYNAGEGRLQHAFRRAGSRTANAAQRKPHGLSNITYDYVDKLQALSCLVQQPERQGLRLPLDARFEPLVPLLMDEDLSSLEQFAARRGKDAAQLRRLNPGFRDGRVVAGVPRLVLSPPGASLPIGTARDVVPQSEALLAQVAEVAPPVGSSALATTSPASPAGLGATEPTLVPTAFPAAAATAPTAVAPAPQPSADPPEAVHEVRVGDTINSIAAHYRLPVEQILRANHLDRDALLRPGQRLRLVP
jgi:membrane-bound lytic murein transglycosylase D